MTTENTVKAAYLNGIRLDTQVIDAGFKKQLAVQEYPGKDVPLIQDMGLSATRIRLRCFFINDRYEKHLDFLELLYGRKSFELFHPDYELMTGSVDNVSVRRDERLETAEVDIEFVEGVTETEIKMVPEVEQSSEALYKNGLDEMERRFVDESKKALGTQTEEMMTRELSEEQGILEQFSGLSKQARDWVKKVDAAVSTFEATLNQVTSPANAMISTINFATNLPGRVIGSVARAANRNTVLLDTIRNAPERFVNSLKDGLAAMEASAFPSHAKASRSLKNMGKTSDNPYTPEEDDADTHVWKVLKAAAAMETGLQTAYIFEEDETRRRHQKRNEGVKSFDVLGNRVNTASAPPASGREMQALTDGVIDVLPEVMNVREIEATLYSTREIILSAVEDMRPGENLKQMAAALTIHVNQIKLDRENITRVSLDNAMPMHLVCLKYGLPYAAAVRILAINTIAEPNFTRGDIDIYVR